MEFWRTKNANLLMCFLERVFIICRSVYLYAGALGDQKHWVTLELELQAVVNHPEKVLGTVLRSSARVGHAVNWVISSGPEAFVLFLILSRIVRFMEYDFSRCLWSKRAHALINVYSNDEWLSEFINTGLPVLPRFKKSEVLPDSCLARQLGFTLILYS